MTPEEKQEIVQAVIAALKTNGRTIMQLTPVTTMTSGDYIELNGGRRVEYSVLYDQLYSAAETAIEAYKAEMWTGINTVSSNLLRLQRQVDINGDGLDRLASDFGLMQGSLRIVAEQLEALAEVYCTEAEYNAMVDAGTIDPNTKYFIYES